MIETERLVLRRPRRENAPDLATAGCARTSTGTAAMRPRQRSRCATRALGEQGMTRLVSLIRHENVRPIRVAERLGERYEPGVDVRGKPNRLYSLER